MAKNSPARFAREVRQETAKVTWPTRKETGITAVMVFIFVCIIALFLFIVDSLIGMAVRFILGLGS